MPDEQDDLAPLMRAVVEYRQDAIDNFNLPWKYDPPDIEAVRRKAEQYGASQRAYATHQRAPSPRTLAAWEEARAAYFEDATASEAAE